MAGLPAFGIPNPISVVTGVLGIGSSGGLLGGLLGGLGSIVSGWISDAAKAAFDQLESLINNSAGSIDFGGNSWWATKVTGGGTGSLWPTVTGIALAVLLGCVLLAVIRGALAGDPMAGLRAVGVEVPKSIFGMAAVIALTAAVSTAVDSASAAVLPSVGANFGNWFASTGAVGFFPSFVELLVLLGALLTWVELVVRQALVFLLVALSPMVLAVRVWPAAAGMWRRLVELGVALIVSKFVIAVALALGSDALAGSPSGGASLTAMTTGAGLMLLSALSPFVLLRMLPGVEAAVAAQGISRMPARAAMTALSVTYSAAMLSRLAGHSTGRAVRPPPAAQPEPGANVSASLARAAALDAGSRPAIAQGGPKALPPGRNDGGGNSTGERS